MNTDETIEKQIAAKLPTHHKDILAIIENTRKELTLANADPQHSITYYRALHELLTVFSLELSSRKLFEAPEGWYFTFTIDNRTATLNLKHIDSIDILETDGAFIKNYCIKFDECFNLFSIPVRLLTVEEFALENKIEQVTVRQWIRRGKLRNVVKVGSEWRIPQITDPPTRGYKQVTYFTNGQAISFPAEFSCTALNPKRIDILPSEQRGLYTILADGCPIDIRRVLYTEQEREKIELSLLSNSKVTNSASVVGKWPALNENSIIPPTTRTGRMREYAE